MRARLKRNLHLWGHTELIAGTSVEVSMIDELGACITGTVWDNAAKDDMEFEEVVSVDDIEIEEEE